MVMVNFKAVNMPNTRRRALVDGVAERNMRDDVFVMQVNSLHAFAPLELRSSCLAGARLQLRTLNAQRGHGTDPAPPQQQSATGSPR